jgi:hypothetical protein
MKELWKKKKDGYHDEVEGRDVDAWGRKSKRHVHEVTVSRSSAVACHFASLSCTCSCSCFWLRHPRPSHIDMTPITCQGLFCMAILRICSGHAQSLH